jgi:hypothetical protein
MKAKLVREEFKENTDPIKDLGIGKIKLSKLHNDLYRKLENEYGKDKAFEIYDKAWHTFLKDLIEGKTITAITQRYLSYDLKKRTLKVAKVIKSEYESFYVRDEKGSKFRIDPDKDMIILD